MIPTNVAYSGSSNPYDEIGMLHNKACMEIVQRDEYFINDSTLDLAAYNDKMQELTSNLEIDRDNLPSTEKLNDIALSVREDVASGKFSNHLNDPDFKAFADEFFIGLRKCRSLEDVDSYIEGVEQIIYDSPLSENKKAAFLSTTSIAHHSTYLW